MKRFGPDEIAAPLIGVVVTEFTDGSSAAEKSELSKADMETHSSKYDIASSVKRFDIFFLSLLLCYKITVMSKP